MNAQIQNILSQTTTTKTHKIQQLIQLGLTRTQIAGLVTNGNYGFVQNVYAKMQREGTLSQAAVVTAIIEETMTPRAFDKNFGVEFEAYNVDKTVLCNKLREAGINCETEGYNHNTRPHWKIVTDSSLRGNQTFELVSTILKGEAGLAEMMKVCNVPNKCSAKVNQTCGTHVHLNASGFSLDQWKRIYINYGRLEGVIDGFMPESHSFTIISRCEIERPISRIMERRGRQIPYFKERFLYYRLVIWRKYRRSKLYLLLNKTSIIFIFQKSK